MPRRPAQSVMRAASHERVTASLVEPCCCCCCVCLCIIGRHAMSASTHGDNRRLSWQRAVPSPARPKEPRRGYLHQCPSGRRRNQSTPLYRLPRAPPRGRKGHTGKTRSDYAWWGRGGGPGTRAPGREKAGGGTREARKNKIARAFGSAFVFKYIAPSVTSWC